jgi:hypothetical protein
MTWPIYISTQMDDLDNMIDPEIGLFPLNYIYPDWPTRMNNPKAVDLARFRKTILRNLPSQDHYLYTGMLESRPNAEGWQITADLPAEKAYRRRFRPNAPFFLDIEFTARLQQESQRDTAISIIDALREHLGKHYGSPGARIGFHTLGMDFVNTYKDFPPAPAEVETIRMRMRYLNRAQDMQGIFEGRAFQDVVDFWPPFVFRTSASDQRSRHVINSTVRGCRAAAPKPILAGWFPYVYGSGRALTAAEIEHDLWAIKNSGADGILLLGDFHKDENNMAAGKVFTSDSPEFAQIKKFALNVNGTAGAPTNGS